MTHHLPLVLKMTSRLLGSFGLKSVLKIIPTLTLAVSSREYQGENVKTKHMQHCLLYVTSQISGIGYRKFVGRKQYHSIDFSYINH